MGIQDMHAYSVTPPNVSASESNLRDPRDAPCFMIGMPHMDGQGLSLSWLLRESGHLHWMSVAEFAGRPPHGLRDLQGNRVLPAVVAGTVAGRPGAFGEDDVVELKLVQRPSPLNGWRSVTEIGSTCGARLTVELVTVFAIRSGTSNRSLELACMAPEFLSERGTMTSRRTDQIRRMGSKERRAVGEADTEQPARSILVSSHLHFNGAGLGCFAGMHDYFVASEEVGLRAEPGFPQVESRRVHYFENIDAGDTLDIFTRSETRLVEGETCLVMTSHARRRTDGFVVAVCESVYGR